ncbi:MULTISPECIES: tRNA (adenosine(37)-N6)-threonylcarbamoyltransferase complex dimerization subunit type 1 TsaB [unclassified Brevundimonas]|uniref:tRNA (adenosine(37)-N6)-threonylcarbamoyltransferase complex dimerization subunit type 1 TsaB n=1 Tax=unclassified Brevundimonas TaxID=2622653 RepID=UPI0025BCE305|nr:MULTISPECIES: tRNA (adenosine(37)-N6)-threonylcarbamoyltransferase complex dimerization subunit type 1 TsaB [unclassified Brevundimonas]
MKVMVIDTALGACLAGCFTVADGQVKADGVRREEMTKGHQERLGGMARDAAADAGGLSGIERIGVTVGPGSFTGLRVGLSFGLGLGAALGAKVVGLSTLDALAASVPASGFVVAAIDARRGQVYMRSFKDGVAISPAEAVPLAEAAERVVSLADTGSTVIVGSGAPVLVEADARLSSIDIQPLAAPTAEALAHLTATLDADAYPPKPLYLRAPDATPPTRLPGQPRTVATL